MKGILLKNCSSRGIWNRMWCVEIEGKKYHILYYNITRYRDEPTSVRLLRCNCGDLPPPEKIPEEVLKRALEEKQKM